MRLRPHRTRREPDWCGCRADRRLQRTPAARTAAPSVELQPALLQRECRTSASAARRQRPTARSTERARARALLDPLHRRYRMLSPTRCSMPDTMCEKRISANTRDETNRPDEQDRQDVGAKEKPAEFSLHSPPVHPVHPVQSSSSPFRSLAQMQCAILLVNLRVECDCRSLRERARVADAEHPDERLAAELRIVDHDR